MILERAPRVARVGSVVMIRVRMVSARKAREGAAVSCLPNRTTRRCGKVTSAPCFINAPFVAVRKRPETSPHNDKTATNARTNIQEVALGPTYVPGTIEAWLSFMTPIFMYPNIYAVYHMYVKRSDRELIHSTTTKSSLHASRFSLDFQTPPKALLFRGIHTDYHIDTVVQS